LRIDLHIHTHHSSDSLLQPEEIIETCQRLGLDGIAVLDHGTMAGALEVAALAPLPVIVGAEIKTTEGEIAGLFLGEEIPRGLSPEETIARIKAQGGLVYIPHPFDRLRRSTLSQEALMRVLPQVDILEAFNSRVMLSTDNRRAAEFAQQRGIPTGAGSDAHTTREIGRAYVEMPPFAGKDDFLANLAQGEVCGRLSPPHIHLATVFIRLGARLGILTQ
jgi:predicted metal-dependent phosphoesterase TrpH